MSLKTIKVNPIFLAGGSSKTRTRKEKPTGVALGPSHSIKKKLIARIKDFQQGGKSKQSTNATADSSGDNDAFSDSVQFLNKLAIEKNEIKKDKNTTLKKKHPYDFNAHTHMQIATELPPELILPMHAMHVPAAMPNAMPAAMPNAMPAAMPAAMPNAMHVPAAMPNAMPIQWSAPPAPLYSNLKTGGSKPTYRTWMRNTQKNKHLPPAKNNVINILGEYKHLQEPLQEQEQVQVPLAVQEQEQVPMPLAVQEQVPMPLAVQEQVQVQVPLASMPMSGIISDLPVQIISRRKKITRTLKYKLGKHANGKVSVLIKNAQTRRKVQTEQALLKQNSILDIKNHLRSKNLLKVGSEAPNDVLRQIYEQSILAGQIENKAKDTLIHNYFNEEKK